MSLPIKSLLVFDAVMHHQSFALAAQQLHVTPGAVGQQIQKLENWLGVRLFVRSIRSIQATPEALSYWAEVQPALTRLQRASDELRHQHVQQVRLSMPPTLAARWFAPRMAAFMSQHPGISLHLSATTALVDFQRDGVDLAIRYFGGDDCALQADLLYPEEIRLFCTPDYVRTLRLKKPDDLHRATLLHSTLLPYWPQWLRQFSSLNTAQIAAIPGQHFDQTMLAIEAARHHQGVVLSNLLLTREELRNGELLEPFAFARLTISKGYYLVHPRHSKLHPAASSLRDWLLAMAAQEHAAPETTERNT